MGLARNIYILSIMRTSDACTKIDTYANVRRNVYPRQMVNAITRAVYCNGAKHELNPGGRAAKTHMIRHEYGTLFCQQAEIHTYILFGVHRFTMPRRGAECAPRAPNATRARIISMGVGIPTC